MVRFGEKGGAMLRLFYCQNPRKHAALRHVQRFLSTIQLKKNPEYFFFISHNTSILVSP